MVYFGLHGYAIFSRNRCLDNGGLVTRVYIENNHSAFATQSAFRPHLGIPRAEPVPSARTIKCRIRRLEETGSTLSGRRHGARGCFENFPPLFEENSL